MHHARTINREIRLAQAMDETELYSYAKQIMVPIDLLKVPTGHFKYSSVKNC